MRFVGEAMSITTALAWAVGVILFRKAGARWSPVALNFFKNAVALLLLVPTVAVGAKTGLSLTATDGIVLAISGIVGIAVADTLFLAALSRIGAGLLAVVDTLYAPSVIALSFVFLHERLDGQALVGAALVVGAIVIGTADRPARGHSRADVVAGVGLGAAAIVLMACGIVLAKPVLDRAPVLWTTSIRMFFGTVGLLPLLASRTHRHAIAETLVPSAVWWWALPGSVVGCFLSSILWIGGMKLTLVSIAATLNQLSSIFIVVLATVFLKEPLSARRIVAVLTATLGAVLVTLR